MSPGYEARASKALVLIKEVHGNDLISDQVKIDYSLCHDLLLKYSGDIEKARVRYKEIRDERDLR